MLSQTEDTCRMETPISPSREVVFTSIVASEGTHGGVCCDIHGDCVIKYFDVVDNEEDEFGMTPKRYFENEINAYKLLNNVKYTTPDGRDLFLTPQCLEIGENYMIFEKYETSLYNVLCEKRCDVLKQIRTYVDPILKKLDELRICHNDVAFRNFVLDYDLNRCAIIDFAMSSPYDNRCHIGENYEGSLILYLTGSLELYDMYPSTRAIELCIINNALTAGDHTSISEHDMDILKHTDFSTIKREQFMALKFEDVVMDSSELDKLWSVISHKNK